MTPASREDVWHAMSDLFLDTDVSLHRDSTLRVLKASGFDLAALDHIFIAEVYPACIGNLLQVAGEWAGFDRARLIAAIRRRQGRRPFLGRFTIWLRWRHARRLVSEWFVLREALDTLD